MEIATCSNGEMKILPSSSEGFYLLNRVRYIQNKISSCLAGNYDYMYTKIPPKKKSKLGRSIDSEWKPQILGENDNG